MTLTLSDGSAHSLARRFSNPVPSVLTTDVHPTPRLLTGIPGPAGDEPPTTFPLALRREAPSSAVLPRLSLLLQVACMLFIGSLASGVAMARGCRAPWGMRLL